MVGDGRGTAAGRWGVERYELEKFGVPESCNSERKGKLRHRRLDWSTLPSACILGRLLSLQAKVKIQAIITLEIHDVLAILNTEAPKLANGKGTRAQPITHGWSH